MFDPLDNPGSDPQYLSAARACFDRGDFNCARENYAKLSSSYSDTATAEQSFLTLDEQGASMGAFMEFVGDMTDKGTGKALTIFANRLTSGSGVTRRVTLWNVYNSAKNGSITNPDLKNFVTFISALALTAEMLAEGAQGSSQLIPGHIATSSSSCQSSGTACAGAAATCNAPAGATLVYGTGAIPDITTTSPSNTNPSTRQLYDMINETLSALTALSASGKFSGAVSDFNSIANVLNGIGGSAAIDGGPNVADQCFRHTLLTMGVGTL
jgi:hypothetical protein